MDIPSFSRTLTIHAIDWECEYDENYCDNDHQQIRVWGLDREDKPHLLRIEDFPASFYLALPETVNTGLSNERKVTWTSDLARSVVDALRWRFTDKSTRRCTMYDYNSQHFGMMERLYYYYGDDNKKPMLLLLFKNAEAMRYAANICKGKKGIDVRYLGNVKGEPLETEIGSILKLLSKQDLTYACWLKVEGNLVSPSNRISTLKDEYIVKWNTMTRISPEGWFIHPKFLSFDIEVYSHRKKAFPDE